MQIRLICLNLPTLGPIDKQLMINSQKFTYDKSYDISYNKMLPSLVSCLYGIVNK